MNHNNQRYLRSVFLFSLVSIPNFSLKVHVFYDDSFKTRFGAAVTTRITSIFNIVKTIYSDASLTTTIEPEVVQISHKTGETWTATVATLQ